MESEWGTELRKISKNFRQDEHYKGTSNIIYDYEGDLISYKF